MIIAIDGYSSTGKSSIAKEVAQKLGYCHIDSGAMYRAITYYALHYCYENNAFNIQQLIASLPAIKIEFKLNNNNINELYLNGVNIETEIRSMEVSDKVSQISKIKEIRTFLVTQQQAMAKLDNIVMEGRDIGSVVFPHADFKFFLTATLDERTQRRYVQAKQEGQYVAWENIKKNLQMRDESDEQRENSPLKIIPDSIVIDNTLLTKEQTIALILKHITKK